MGQSRRFDRPPTTSGLPRGTDIARAVRLVRFAPILLQKSVSVDDLSGISLRAVGVDLPTLTLSTQLPRYAMHMAPAGGGRATSDASRRRFWAIAARTNSSWAPRGAKNAGPLWAPVHWAAGSDGETNFGTTSLAVPHAVSSRVARYSFTARLDLAGSRSLRQSWPAIDRCLLASAWIRLASTAKPSPPTRPAAMHASTTRSNTRRKTSPSRKRSLRARENAE